MNKTFNKQMQSNLISSKKEEVSYKFDKIYTSLNTS